MSSITEQISEQISRTSKTQLESQLDFLNSVLKNTVDGASEIVALNLNTARNVAERGTAAARQLIEARDTRAVLDLARPLSAIEGLFAYQRELFSIASKTQQAFLQTATDRFRDVPGKTLVLAAPAVAQVPETVVNAAVAAANAAGEAAQAATSGATEAAAHAVHAASDAAQAATGSAAEAARNTQGALAEAARASQDGAEQAVRATTEEIDDAVEAADKAAQDTAEAGVSAAAQAAETAAAASARAVEDASDILLREASASPSAADAVAAAVERVTEAAAQAPAPVTASSAPLFDTDHGTHTQRSTRSKSRSSGEQPVAAQADKPAGPAKSAPGKSRK
ncbi:phasin family protein [Massilia sp. METH4]|uniref:phasin family protein n=1 Tax=Massilia sp. METH4 TaxID=3123041 RepID=UPI0030D03DCD